jgi:enoyl-CoA hydratase
MAYENLRIERADAVATVWVDRPKALNALNSATLRELGAAFAELASDATLRAVILTGSGEKAFVAGADIAQMSGLTPEQGRQFAALGHEVFEQIERLPVPVLAAVNGFALGGGCELALACDLIYASERARFGLPEVGLGVIPGFGGTQRLQRTVGRHRARELVLTGEMIDAAKAKEVGLALEVLPADQLLARCREVAQKIASRGPLAIRAAKRVVSAGGDVSQAAGAAIEREAFGLLFGTEDQREGMAAFAGKRPPNFKGA